MNGEKMKKIALLLLVSLACVSVNAQKNPTKTSYVEARRLYDQFDKTLSRALLWEKTSVQDRRKAINDAIQLRETIDKALGEFSQCSKAGAAHVDFVLNLNSFSASAQSGSAIKPFDVLGAMQSAERFGNSRAPCYDEVAALEIKK